MNIKTQLELEGDIKPIIPLGDTAKIIHGNALRQDWNEVIPSSQVNYIISNPPFISKKNRNDEQNEDMKLVFTNKVKNYGLLDYVCAWYAKATDYIQGTKIGVGFVSTNSITQGEQAGTLWQYLFKKNIQINFAHRTFKWSNDAKGNAQVYVVIIGFTNYDTDKKILYDYATPKSEASQIKAKSINPYLVDYENILIVNRSKPLCVVPEIKFGSMPNDDGNFIFTDDEKKEFLKHEPDAKEFIKPLLSAKEYLNGKKRWCLWLDGIAPNEYAKLKMVMERVDKVKQYRLASDRKATKKLSATPYLFGENRQPNEKYILIPRHSSEARKFIPMGFFNKTYIASDSCLSIPNATLFHFGILMSSMHMAWVRQICGRIKSDYRYSNNLVYNNYPFPENVSDKNKNEVDVKAKNVLDIREKYPESSLAVLYNPNTMPADLVKAHQALDKAVDKCYGKTFETELSRIEFLFDLFKKLTAPLLVEEGKKVRKKKAIA